MRASEELEIPAAGAVLRGDLHAVPESGGIVVFAHGSGSSRLSRRNRHVAAILRDYGFATLLFDLLTEAEERLDMHTGEYRFDIPLLTERLITVTRWLIDSLPELAPIGLFGSSTGAAAALGAAAAEPQSVRAVVSRGGRPDLAAAALENVEAPTLLIVGGNDPEVLQLNEYALARLHCEKSLVVIPSATHLFEEPGTLDAVAHNAGQWFADHLAATAA
jgi:putative phosphoribosyl transferase